MQKSSGQIDLTVIQAGVSNARVSAYRLRQLLQEVLQQVENSDAKEHLYKVAGDAIVGAPAIMDALDRALTQTQYTVTTLQRRDLRKSLPLDDVQIVDQAIKSVPDVMPKQADLDPQLGWPGGRCHVVDRIEEEAPRRKDLMEQVESGDDLSNTQATSVYNTRVELGDGMFRHMILTAHAQYRMDLRSVAIPQIKAVLRELAGVYSKAKSQGDDSILKRIQSREGYEYTSKGMGLTIVLKSEEPKVATIISVWWEGERDPRATSCRVAYQHKQRGQDKLKAQRYYRQHKNQIKRRAVTRYRKIKNTSKVKRYRKMYKTNPQKFRRRMAMAPLVFWWEPKQDYLTITGIEDGRLVGYLGDLPATVSLEAFDHVAVAVSPGAVMGILALLEQEFGGASHTAAKIADIQMGLSPKVQDSSQALQPQLTRVSPERNQWLFRVGDHKVKIRAEGKGRVASRHLRVSCSCPAWQYSGAEHWAAQEGYLLGKPRGTATEPTTRDPNKTNRACKHVVACLRVVKEY